MTEIVIQTDDVAEESSVEEIATESASEEIAESVAEESVEEIASAIAEETLEQLTEREEIERWREVQERQSQFGVMMEQLTAQVTTQSEAIALLAQSVQTLSDTLIQQASTPQTAEAEVEAMPENPSEPERSAVPSPVVSEPERRRKLRRI